MEKFYKKLFRNVSSVAISVSVCCLLMVGVAWAATTISTNIVTGGNLTVSGWATSTSATSTNYLYLGPDFTEDANMNYTGGDLFVANDVNVGGVTYLDGALQATSTALFTGTATFYDSTNAIKIDADTTTGINLTTNVTATDGILIAGANADGIHVSGANTATGLNISGANLVGIDLGDANTTALDIGSATNRIVFSGTTGGTATDGSLIKAGTAAAKISSATADHKFLVFYLDSSATSGDNRGIYNRFYISGAGGGGESLRSYTEIVGVAAGTAHGAHISLGMGESTTGGAVTGLGVGVRATLGLPDVALASGGTYAAMMAEIYSFGASSDAGAVTELSYIRFVNDGHADGKSDVDDDAYLFSLQGITAGANSTFDTTISAVTNPQLEATLKIKVGATEYWIPLCDTVGCD